MRFFSCLRLPSSDAGPDAVASLLAAPMDWVLSSRNMRATAEAVDEVRVEGVKLVNASSFPYHCQAASGQQGPAAEAALDLYGDPCQTQCCVSCELDRLYRSLA